MNFPRQCTQIDMRCLSGYLPMLKECNNFSRLSLWDTERNRNGKMFCICWHTDTQRPLFAPIKLFSHFTWPLCDWLCYLWQSKANADSHTHSHCLAECSDQRVHITNIPWIFLIGDGNVEKKNKTKKIYDEVDHWMVLKEFDELLEG